MAVLNLARSLALAGAIAAGGPGSLAFAQEAGPPPWQDWRSTLETDHPLAGKIWSVPDNRLIAPQALADALSGARYVLLGETHDNADHHRLQAWLIDQIAASGRRPAVVMEMISRDQSSTLDAYMARPDANAAGLGPALGWDESGWPAWHLYQPIAEAAFRGGLSIVPGNPPREKTRLVGEQGLGALEDGEANRLGLDRPLPPDLDQALLEELEQSHCGLMPLTALGPMKDVQRFRDASLAGALAQAGRRDGAVLIAGAGHVRTDRGVPLYLAGASGATSVAAVMFVEIVEDAASEHDLFVTDPQGSPAAGFFWFTPRTERDDPCEQLRRRMENRPTP